MESQDCSTGLSCGLTATDFGNDLGAGVGQVCVLQHFRRTKWVCRKDVKMV
ncbi:unnamed protein product [Sordaria macrospora k-hell]|uniref:WGS project CABT00000000 data, contig 2.7 n=1 Tax=Sordaria macrospora (strain ATCC MYA-333 / DSM 997 / K(L3346) / K-hell) TaxID=771870 RepID=F7VTQ1_SORMK|nr:uncharacterized protein SMAC_12816 [Sordaria macrospora k-hell]CCC08889.1 unnamed protein product [Sordaria macrospora k-hell]